MRRNDEVQHDDMELLVENADNRDPKTTAEQLRRWMQRTYTQKVYQKGGSHALELLRDHFWTEVIDRSSN